MCRVYHILLSFVASRCDLNLSAQAALSGVPLCTLSRQARRQGVMRSATWARYRDWLIRSGLAYQLDPAYGSARDARSPWLFAPDHGDLPIPHGARVLLLVAPDLALLLHEVDGLPLTLEEIPVSRAESSLSVQLRAAERALSYWRRASGLLDEVA